MKHMIEVRTTVDLDEWEIEGIKWAYHQLGWGEKHAQPGPLVSSVAHDLLHQLALSTRQTVLDNLAFHLPSAPEPPLTRRQIELANLLEGAWLDADERTRREFLVRLGAWQTGQSRHWTLTLNSPLVREVAP